MNKKILFILGGLLILLILVIFGFYYNNQAKYSQQKKQLFKTDLQTIINQDLAKNNPNIFSFSSKIEALLQNSTIRFKDDETRAKIILADSNLMINPIKGVKILKEVVLDFDDSNFNRAWAARILVNFYEFSPDINFSKNDVFTGNLFSDFIKDSDVDIAYRELSRFAEQLYPHSINNYRIALWYAKQLSNTNLTEKEKNQYHDLIKSNLENGDKKISQIKNNSEQGLAYRLKAQVLEMLYFYGDKEVALGDVKSFYEQSLFSLEQPPVGLYMRIFDKYTRFYYAVFLAKTDGEKEAERIKDLLKPLYDLSIRNWKIFTFIKTESLIGDQYKIDIENLSKINPRFKSLLEQL